MRRNTRAAFGDVRVARPAKGQTRSQGRDAKPRASTRRQRGYRTADASKERPRGGVRRTPRDLLRQRCCGAHGKRPRRRHLGHSALVRRPGAHCGVGGRRPERTGRPERPGSSESGDQGDQNDQRDSTQSGDQGSRGSDQGDQGENEQGDGGSGGFSGGDQGDLGNGGFSGGDQGGDSQDWPIHTSGRVRVAGHPRPSRARRAGAMSLNTLRVGDEHVRPDPRRR